MTIYTLYWCHRVPTRYAIHGRKLVYTHQSTKITDVDSPLHVLSPATASNMSLLQFTNDTLLFILSLCDLPTLLTLSETSPGLHRLVQNFLLSEWNCKLASLYLPPIRTRQLMRDVNMVVSGSMALRFVLRDYPRNTAWRNNDVDIYCGKSSETAVLQFVTNEHYFPFPPNDNYPHSSYSLPGIERVHHLRHPSGMMMDIIVSSRDNALLPISNFWGTLLQNYIAADHFTIAYPSTTLRQIRYVAPQRDNISNTERCIAKYLQRGFDIRRFIQDTTPLYCPTAIRSFNDTVCLTYALNDHYFPNHDADEQWQLSTTCQCLSH